MHDAAGSSRLQHAGDRARHTITVKEVWQLLFDAGVPRSERRIKYFCQNGTLDAGYLPSPTGDQWYVNPSSVPGLISELKQFEEQQRSRKQHAAAASDSPEKPLNTNSDAAGSSMRQPAATDLQNKDPKPAEGMMQHAVAGYVSQLEKRIEEKDMVIGMLRDQLTVKDQQISRHSERERETNLLIRGLQNLVLRLQPGRAANADVFDGDSLMRTPQAESPAA
jgi:hypothetical protein